MRRRWLLVLAALAALGLLWMRSRPEVPPPSPARVTPARALRPALAVAPPTPVAVGRKTHALLISGGGTPEQNYQSHLLHVRELVRLLGAAGLPADQVTALVGDGDDPGADLAVRQSQPESDFWLVEPTPLGALLRTPVVLGNSTVEGARLFPATRAALSIWFLTARERVRSGDTLLLYVTDHGTQGKGQGAARADDNRITLWGKNESISVRELEPLLASLDPGVRVVLLMSQCYSGGFARLMRPATTAGEGGVCGFFSSTADRPAYGCYPENLGKDNVGHSFLFLRGLARTGAFPAAHEEVLASDATPDVPLQTSDVYLERIVQAVARDKQRPLDTVVDDLLAERRPNLLSHAGQRPGRIAQGFGLPEPGGLPSLQVMSDQIADTRERLAAALKSLQVVQRELASANLSRFVHAHPAWASPLQGWVAPPAADGTLAAGGSEPRSRPALSEEQKRKLAASLLPELRRYTMVENPSGPLQEMVQQKVERLKALVYRLEVRQAVALRMRTALTSLAGRVHVTLRGSKRDRDELLALDECESLSLPMPDHQAPNVAPALPPLHDDLALAASLSPADIGFEHRPSTPEERQSAGGPLGTARVSAVVAGGPAERAGLVSGDLIIGGPGVRLTEMASMRAWALSFSPGETQRLEVVRDGERLEILLTPDQRLEDEPRPTRRAVASRSAGTTVASGLTGYRGDPPGNLADGQRRVLFFWATWCGPCKSALPELLSFGAETGTAIVAITQEPADTLDAFFGDFRHPFPATIAIDADRKLTTRFEVGSLPTIIVLDESGAVRARRVGFLGQKWLGLPGWNGSPGL